MGRKFSYLILSFFILGLILIMAIIVSSNNFINNKLLEDDDKYMASYIDGEYQNEIPYKDEDILWIRLFVIMVRWQLGIPRNGVLI